MAARLHHLEIIPGDRGHTVRHFMTSAGESGFQTKTHTFPTSEAAADHVEDALDGIAAPEDQRGPSPETLANIRKAEVPPRARKTPRPSSVKGTNNRNENNVGFKPAPERQY
jgi:hypothetical protein